MVGGEGASSGKSNHMFGKIPHNKGTKGLIKYTDEQKEARKKLAIAKNFGDRLPDMGGWNKGTKGVMKPNKTSFKKGMIPYNKGKSNPNAKENAIKGIEKSRKSALGRKMAIRPDGSRYWIKPETIAVPSG